ncbi:MAG: hypothetical protein IPK52_18750 [Chloroflexi bacterium]|nr:hypothetical protein [Chloroflexota bacterium]
MKPKPMTLLLVLLLAVIATSTVAAQSPRVVPSNDNSANALPIKLGKNYTVLDIGAATNEAGEPNVSCYTNTPLRNSVWFKVELDAFTQMYFAADDARLYTPTGDSYDTTLAIFSGDSLGTLIMNGCGEDSDVNYSEMWYGGIATTYYVVIGTYEDVDYLPGSSIRLVTRAMDASVAIDNYDFETAISPADWKVKNATGDEVVCLDVTYPAPSGDCTFKFAGSAGESSKLSQAVTLPTYLAPRKNAIVYLSYDYQILDAMLGSAKVKLKIIYSDGTPTSTRTINLTGGAVMPGSETPNALASIASKNVAAIKIEVVFKSTTGTLLVDDFKLRYYALTGTRDGILPAPAPAQ